MDTTLDTLKLFDNLKGTFTEEQAHKLSDVFKQVEKSRLDALATKADLQLLETKIDVKVETVKAEIIKWVAAMLVAQAGVITALNKLI
jgi:hypothetical protein